MCSISHYAQEELKQHPSIVLYWQCHMQLTTLIHSAQVARSKVGSDRLASSSAFSECDLGLNWYSGTNYIINCRLNCFGSWSSIMLKGVTFPTHGWDVRPISMHWVSWPIRAQLAFPKKELYRNQRVLERLIFWSQSLFSTVIQKPMKSYWVIVEETRVMLRSALSKLCHPSSTLLSAALDFLSLMQSIIG